jgi:hypothetical protein
MNSKVLNKKYKFKLIHAGLTFDVCLTFRSGFKGKFLVASDSTKAFQSVQRFLKSATFYQFFVGATIAEIS